MSRKPPADKNPQENPMEQRLEQIRQRLFVSHGWEDPPLSIEALVDAIFAVYQDCKTISSHQRDNVAKFIEKYEPTLKLIQSLRVNSTDFDVIAHLAKGGFGKVSLVRAKFDGKLYALKSLKKTEVLKQENVYFMEERNIMAICNSEWITSLYASFQDEENLYLVMEYIPGGDLITLLESKDDNVLTEDEAKFYVAETICAVEELHKLNIVHRDLKPHNILIDKTGHIKLADFGACIQLDENNQVTSNITVGTPDYVSPEVLRAQEGNSSYGKECDWWSLGVVLYEIMFGDPPFYAETITATYAMIMNHKKSLKFPEDIEISEDCKDLIKQLLSDRSGRLGKNGPEEIKKHPWFKGIEWNKLKSRTPPFIPRLTGEEDTRYFPEVDEDEEEEVPPVPTRGRNFAGLHLPFIGYSFSRNFPIYDSRSLPSNSNSELKSPSIPTLSRSQAASISAVNDSRIQEFETKVKSLEGDIHNLKAQLERKEKSIASLESEKSQQADRMAALQSHLERKAGTENQLEKLEQEKALLEIEISETKKSYEAEVQQRSAVEKKLSELQSLYTRVQNELATATDNLQKAVAEKDQFEANVATAKEELRNQISISNEQKSRINELSQQKALLEVELDSLKQKLTQEVVANKEFNEQRLLDLQKSEALLTAQLKDAQDKYTQAMATEKELSTKLSEIEAALKREIRSKEEVQKKLIISERSNIELSGELERAIGELDKTKTASHESDKIVSELRKAIKMSELELESTQRKLNETIEEQRRELDTTKTINDEYRNKTEELQIAARKLHETIQDKEKEIEVYKALKVEYERRRKDFEHAESVIADKDTMIDSLTKNLKKREEELYNVVEKLAADNAQDTSKPVSKRLKMDMKDLQVRLDQASAKIEAQEQELSEARAALEKAQQEVQRLTSQLQIYQTPLTPSEPKTPIKSSFALFKKTQKPSVIEIDFRPQTGSGFRGYLRMPKNERAIRHGWRKRFFVVRDFKLYMYEKEKEADTEPGVLVADIRSDVFAVRAITNHELFHASAKEIECIFKIQVSNNSDESSSTSSIISVSSSTNTAETLTPEDIEKRIKDVKKKIEIEEQLRLGAEKFLKVAQPAQKAALQKQLETADEKLKRYEIELEKLHHIYSPPPTLDLKLSSQPLFKENGVADSQDFDAIFNQADLLEKQIKTEEALLEGAKKISSARKDFGKASGQAETMIHTAQARVDGLKAELERWRSGQNLDKVPEKEQVVEMNGHQFKVQHYNVPTSCQLCHDTLWGARKQGYECIVCKYVCHKNCHSFVKDPCHEVLKLKTAKSIYFMTADPEEKRKWIHALEAYRKYHEEKGVGTGSMNFGTNSTISNSDKSGRSTLSKRDLSMNLSLPEDGNNGRRSSIGM